MPGDIVAGKYRVERVLGSGGMGVVVAATHLELDQVVALKFILPQALSGKGNVERFMREARAAVRLKSEHVARVHDVGRDAEDRPFMVLELLEGMDLAKLNRQKGPLPVADAVEYILQACEALVEAHAAGIVHRDLKPQNLFVTRRLNGTPLVKVLDFGIAKAIGPGAAGQLALTDSAAIIGSPLYMAPEQMRSARNAEIRSDIWALGVILFELLGGQLPFDGETVTEVCIRVVNEEPLALLSLRPALEPALVAIVMRCLEKDPDERWHNVSALASALEPFSRSAQQGGPVRPWRSFEDTQDSRQPSPVTSAADATGPATLVTIETLPGDDDPSTDERRARANAGTTKPSRGTKGLAADAPRPLVSTDPTWADSSNRAPPTDRPPRSFSTGVVIALVAAAAAAAALGGLVLGRGSSPTAASASSATASAAALEGATDAGVTTASAPSIVPMPVAVATAPPAAPSPGSSAAIAARLLSAKSTPRLSAAPRPTEPLASSATSAGTTAPAAPVARPAEAKPAAEPATPNGAPILH